MFSTFSKSILLWIFLMAGHLLFLAVVGHAQSLPVLSGLTITGEKWIIAAPRLTLKISSLPKHP